MFLIDRELQALVAFRRELHRRPEVSGEERETAETIVAALADTKPDVVMTGLGGRTSLGDYGQGASLRP